MSTVTTTETQSYCHECENVTKHVDDECVVCARALQREAIAWMRLKRKAFVIGVSIVFIFAIMWAMAQDFSGDDVVRGVLVSIVSGLGVWIGTSLKSEEKIREST